MPIQVLGVKSRNKVKLDPERGQTYLDRLTGQLEDIQSLLNTRRHKRRDYASAQIEKARRGNPANRLVDVELNLEKIARAEATDGRYLLGINDFDLSALEMLTRFKKQEVVEQRIKVVKDPIRVHPID